MVWALEQVPVIVENILKHKDPAIVFPSQKDGEGVGAVEAPRGTLYHYYKMKDGLVDKANLIIPTGQSLEDVERYMRKAVETMLDREAADDDIRLQAEMIARSYDPCISCSTHMVQLKRDS